MDLKNLISTEDLTRLHELKKLAPIIKNKWFSLGRDMDKFVKTIDELGKVDGLSQTPISNKSKV